MTSWNGHERRTFNQRIDDCMTTVKSDITEIKRDIQNINKRVDDHFLQESVASGRLSVVEKDLSDIKTDLSELIGLYKQGVGVAKFVKIMLPFAIGFWAFIAWAKEHIRL